MSQLITTPEIRTEPTKRWLLPLLEAIQNVSGMIGKGSLILMLSMSAVSNSMAESERNASSRHTPLPVQDSMADPSVLWDAGDSDRGIILEYGDACPNGGEKVVSNTAIVIDNKNSHALQAERVYFMNRGDSSQFVVFCGHSVMSGYDWFNGNAVIASDPSILDPSSGIKLK